MAESDVLCAPVPAGGRLTGPILALHWWLQHALTAFATARFFGKADDDVYLHLPGIEAMLRGLPAEAAPYSYLGKMMYKIATERTTLTQPFPYPPHFAHLPRIQLRYVQLTTQQANGNGSARYDFHAFGPTAHFSRLASPPSARLTTSMMDRRCATCAHAGPLPFACGPFFSMGRGVVQALLLNRSSRRALGDDLLALRSLPPTHSKVLACDATLPPMRRVQPILQGACAWMARACMASTPAGHLCMAPSTRHVPTCTRSFTFTAGPRRRVDGVGTVAVCRRRGARPTALIPCMCMCMCSPTARHAYDMHACIQSVHAPTLLSPCVRGSHVCVLPFSFLSRADTPSCLPRGTVQVPLHLFALGPPLYLDASSRFRGLPSVLVWHNRLKLVRLKLYRHLSLAVGSPPWTSVARQHAMTPRLIHPCTCTPRMCILRCPHACHGRGPAQVRQPRASDARLQCGKAGAASVHCQRHVASATSPLLRQGGTRRGPGQRWRAPLAGVVLNGRCGSLPPHATSRPDEKGPVAWAGH